MVRAFKMHASLAFYELPWNCTDFSPQMFAQIEERHMRAKLDMLACYESQRKMGRQYMDPSTIRSTMEYRGLQVGAKYAEAFEVMRWRM
jgi:hypothetical protein